MSPQARHERWPSRLRGWPIHRTGHQRSWGLGLLLGVGCMVLMFPSWGAVLTVTVLLPDGRPQSGMVVMARPTAGPSRPAPPVQAVMDQVHRTFEPKQKDNPKNTKETKPNSDTVSHQIYSFSPAKRFQLPLY